MALGVSGIGWGARISNLGMAESKSAALPLGYTPAVLEVTGLYECFEWGSRVNRRSVVTTPCVQGGKIAERFGDASFQGGLIVFNREEIMAVAVPDMAADLALGEHRVARNDAAVQWQSFQQNERSGDLVLIGFDRQIADDGAKPGRKGRQDMHGFIVQATAAAQRLTVNGDVLGLTLLEREAAESSAQGVGVKGLKEIMIRCMAGRFAGLDAKQAKRLGASIRRAGRSPVSVYVRVTKLGLFGSRSKREREADQKQDPEHDGLELRRWDMPSRPASKLDPKQRRRDCQNGQAEIRRRHQARYP